MPRTRGTIKGFSIVNKLVPFYSGGDIQITKDGCLMLCSHGEQLNVVRVNDSQIIRTFGEKGNAEELSTFILADDDETLFIATKSEILRQYNLKNGSVVRTWKSNHVGGVSCMALNASSVLLATGGCDSKVKIWNLNQRCCTHSFKGFDGVLNLVKFHAENEQEYIFGAAEHQIQVSSLLTNQQVASLEGHHSAVTGLVIVKSKDTILSCSRDKVILVWSLSKCLGNENALMNTIPVFEAVESVFLAPKSMVASFQNKGDSEKSDIYFVTAGDKGILRVWKASTGKCMFAQTSSVIALPEDSKHEGQLITQAMYVPALKAICLVTYEHNIVLHRASDLALLKQFSGHNDEVHDVKLMGMNEEFLVVATNSPHIKVFELSTSSCQLLKGHSADVIALDVFSSHPNIFVSGSKDNSVRVWVMDLTTKEINCLYEGVSHVHSVSAVACSKGKTKMFLSGSEDTVLKLWDIPNKIPLVALKLSLSPRLNSSGPAHRKIINCIEVSTNDKLIATCSQDCTAKVWDASNLSLVGTMIGHRKGVWCAAFSPVDLVLATSSADGTVKMWSLNDFSVLKTFVNTDAAVLKICFLSRGTQFISSSSNGLIKLWDIKSSECMKVYDVHENNVWALTVSSKEEFVVSGGADSNIIIWKDVTQEENEKIFRCQQQSIHREQELLNMTYQERWPEALKLTVVLDQPYRALEMIRQMQRKPDWRNILKQTLLEMSPEQHSALVKFTVEWNTNAKNCSVAQYVLNLILKLKKMKEVLELQNERNMVESMLPYTDRHFKRCNELLQQMQLLSFTRKQFS